LTITRELTRPRESFGAPTQRLEEQEMQTVLMAELARARSEEFQRRAASPRTARAVAGARHPRRRPRIRRRVGLISMRALSLWTSSRAAGWRSQRDCS
jgi:hypothetical protein